MDPAARESLGDVKVAALASFAPGRPTNGQPPTRPGPASGSLAAAGQGLSQSYLFEALLSVFRSIAASGPVLLVIEDLHWADAATRDAIAFLVPNLVRTACRSV